MKEIDQEEIYHSVNPLDRRDGRVPSWAEISNEFGLDKLLPGERKLIQSYYRAQRKLALGQEKRGKRLIGHLVELPHFVKLEERRGHILSWIAKRVRGKEA